MDYFSLDIEGAEFQVLKTIPFDKVDIKILQVEMNHVGEIFDGTKENFKHFLDINGYDHVGSIAVDEIFVKRSFQ